MFAIWNRCQEAINAARITCNSTQHITGCGARCTAGGHDAVMSGEDSQRHRSELAPGGVVVAFAATTIIALPEMATVDDDGLGPWLM
jgi:hypothetical protein